MNKTDKLYKAYVNILKEELVPAMGCTEPIAVAYCAATAKKYLGCTPTKVKAEISGNIIKNIKSVIVPNTDGLFGIEAAVSVGIVAGNPDNMLQVISNVTDNQKQEIKNFISNTEFVVTPAQAGELLDITITLFADDKYAKVRISGNHTNIVLIETSDEVIYKSNELDNNVKVSTKTDRNLLTVNDIYDFANSVDTLDVEDVLERQIKYNTAISHKGLTNNYGANVGQVLLKTGGDNVWNRAKAVTAAGSDARMNGCELPVIINSGSGNQGMTASLPVIEYAKELNVTKEKLYRALVISNLVTIHQKTGIGSLSAYCGAVCAGCGAGAGIAYLYGEDCKAISHTIVNSLAIVSGIICDGAKSSCAAKIALSVDAGILGYQLYKNGQEFKDGEGIVSKGVENTIHNVGRLGKDGMFETDKEILKIMTGC